MNRTTEAPSSTPAVPANSRQQHIGWWLQQAARHFNARALQKLRGCGHPHLTATHLGLLPYLDVAGTRINTLAERATMTKQAASQIVTELEKSGYVQRQPDPSDGRAVLVVFTRRGHEFLADAAALKQELTAEFTQKLGEQPFQTLQATLERLLEPEA